jgi:hypothetical protein
MQWCQRHPCPRHHDEHSGQYQGTGQEQGGASKNSVPSACPTRGTPTVFHANHGQPKPLLKGSVVTSHVVPKLMMNAVPPAGLRSRMVRGLGAKVVGHQGGAVFRHVGA